MGSTAFFIYTVYGLRSKAYGKHPGMLKLSAKL